MNANQVFQYNIAASGLDVDQLIRQLADYGITNVQAERGPNVNGISLTLDNPTPEQLQAVKEILMPLENNLQASIYRALRPIFGSQIQNLPSMTYGPQVMSPSMGMPPRTYRPQIMLPSMEMQSRAYGPQIQELPSAGMPSRTYRPQIMSPSMGMPSGAYGPQIQELPSPGLLQMQRTQMIPTSPQSPQPVPRQIMAPNNVQFTVPPFEF